ncbi:hypothetical protein DEU56DRAFT_912033 [Suillus clintonianus]|uniref:uncharacterized protein n=1 Tax=Suillus clintonianus TaxID=1904413 RepID=UPI001B87463C|nr:uncharacterized protein DEU56DRAFT_912033 [Suillus clintonianus]KAG2139769.1 hypothetical protein DEU56DRAFT_912033 [Suillus clintonianus]
MKGVLQDQLVHQCLDVVLESLKLAARLDIMMSDLIGHKHYCFTPIASYIADTPEAMMLAYVGGKTSPVTMAMYKQFGDAFQHEPRTKSTTLAQLDIVHSCADPHNLEAFSHEAQKFHLNGVEKPFWSDWPLAKPSRFFTPESLHHLHKQFYNHDIQWITSTVGDSELDFRFSILQPTTGYRHFHRGILKLKQHGCNASWYYDSVRALMHFRYLVQSPHIYNNDLAHISAALDEFHVSKHAIITAGIHWGKGNTAINNWHIPKLELMQNIVPSIHRSGIIGQWSADATEHVHITEVKDPARSTNNNNYDPQICRFLDRTDKCNRLDLATSLLDHKVSVKDLEVVQEEHKDDDIYIDADADADIVLWILCPRLNNLHEEVESIPVPLHSFIVGCTALHLAYDPSIRNISVNETAVMFNLPDLHQALADFLHHEVTSGHHVHAIGGPRRAGPDAELPFVKLQAAPKITP